MSNVDQTLIGPDATIKQAIETIERSDAKAALIIDAERRLLGTVTDGDVRRGILRGIGLDEPVTRIMNASPRVARPNDDPASMLDIMRRNICRQIPMVDDAGHVIGLKTLEEALRVPMRPNWVLLMAGGRGQRLRPLTDDCPKPMLPIGGRPIMQIILESLVRQGFQRFFISVNYRREMVRDYFGDGARWNAKIDYLEEDAEKPLGTAGPVALLPERPQHPLIVINGDILTKVAFGALLDFHNEHKCAGTMCVRDYVQQVPYGVIEIDEHRLSEIVEKPVKRYLVNAGIYVLEPEAIDLVPRNTAFDMPALFDEIRRQGMSASVFPVREYWMDVGHMSDFQKANDDYFREFMEFEINPPK